MARRKRAVKDKGFDTFFAEKELAPLFLDIVLTTLIIVSLTVFLVLAFLAWGYDDTSSTILESISIASIMVLFVSGYCMLILSKNYKFRGIVLIKSMLQSIF